MGRKPYSAAKGQPGGITGKGYKPGQSGNPGGKAKGLGRYIRERAGAEGKPMVDFALGVIEGKLPPELAKLKLRITLDHVQWACNYISDRGWGKPTQMLVGDKDTPLVVQVVREVIGGDGGS